MDHGHPDLRRRSYQELYPGIDLRYEGTEGHLKSLYYVSPGADPSAIRWRYNGSTGVSVDEAGDLLVSLPAPVEGKDGNTLIERAHLAYSNHPSHAQDRPGRLCR